MSAFVLKIIASVCMLLDHIGAVFWAETPKYFRWIGRIAFPIYAYMIAQGCKHTKNINRYLLRLGVFALISEIPFDMAFKHYTYIGEGFIWNINFIRETNVFYTLFLGAACIVIYEKLKTKQRQWLALLALPFLPAILLVNFIPSLSANGLSIAGLVLGLYTAGALFLANFLKDVENAGDSSFEITFKRKIISFLAALPLLLTAGALKTDYGVFGVGLIFFLYLANPRNRIARTIVLAAGVIYHNSDNLISEYGNFIDDKFVVTGRMLNWYSLCNLFFVLISVILIFLYNGKQGPKIKWAFYVFYPVHIAILTAIWYFVM